MPRHCGAKTRAGGKCKAPAMRNGRCRVHGGASTGPVDQTGNANAVTHGIYARFMAPEEVADVMGVELGSVDHELRLARVRLMRALQAEQAAAGRPEILEVIENEGGGLAIARESKKSVVRDYQGIIDKCLARIESLEKTRKALDEGSAENDEIGAFETLPYDEA